MEKTIIFTTGMYRSGTTMLARLLQGQEGVAAASDPIRPFFNYFRTFILSKLNLDYSIRADAPLGDYFRAEYDYVRGLLEFDLNHQISFETLVALRMDIYLQSKPYCPRFSNAITQAQNPSDFKYWTWKDEFIYYMELIDSVYGDKNAQVIAFKEVWCIEMAIPLINTFGDAIKIVGVERNPKAIFASSKNGAGNYPVLYIARQWRKQRVFFEYLEQYNSHQFKKIKYEDFCQNAEQCYIANFGQFFSGSKIAVSQLPRASDDFGNPWIKNSSFQVETTNSVDVISVDKWKKELTSEEIEWLDYLTTTRKHHQLESAKIPSSKYPLRKIEKVASWLESIVYDLEKTNLRSNLKVEKERFELVKQPEQHLIDPIENLNQHI